MPPVLEVKQDTPQARTHSPAIFLKNVLYATDFSVTSESAFPYAAAICRRFGSTLHLAHVLSESKFLLMSGGVDYVSVGTLYEDAHSEAREKIEDLATRVETIPCRTYVRHGRVWTNLSDIVVENGIDLIVLGTHGRTGFGKLLLGSVAEDILRHAACPVLTIGPTLRGRARLPESPAQRRALVPVELEWQHILYATNLTHTSLAAAQTAVALAEELAAYLTLLHVIESYANLEDKPGPIETGVRQLQDMVPQNAVLAHAPEIVMEFGSAPACIVKVAAEREADLIVLGASSAQATRLPRSTVYEVVAHAPCPVLTVPAPAN